MSVGGLLVAMAPPHGALAVSQCNMQQSVTTTYRLDYRGNHLLRLIIIFATNTIAAL